MRSYEQAEILFLSPVWLVDEVRQETAKKKKKKRPQITALSGTSEEEEDKSLYWLFCSVFLLHLNSHHFNVHQT